MLLPLKLRVTRTPEDLQNILSKTTIGGAPLKIISCLNKELRVAITLDTSPAAAIKAIQEALPGCEVSMWEESIALAPDKAAARIASMKLDPVDVINVKTISPSVWDVVFKKPPPVFDRQHWGDSEVSDKFIYIPNCTRFKGPSCEDYNSNAMYTQIMLAAYQNVCKGRGVNPLVRFQSGKEMPVLSLRAFHGAQTHVKEERASGLANSVLVDFSDGGFGGDFIAAVSLLDETDFQSEPARQTVLAKSELILAGKSSHMYNQRFMREFFDLMTVNYAQELEKVFESNSVQAQTSILNIFRGMVIDGFVLENNKEEFKVRMWTGGLGQYEEFISKLYAEVHCG